MGHPVHGPIRRHIFSATGLGLIFALVAGLASMSPAAADTPTRPDFVPGEAKGSTTFFDAKVQITGAVGSGRGLGIGFGSGRALAEYHDQSSVSEGRALDYSLLTQLNPQPTVECPDIIPLFANSTLPPLTRAESSNPNSATSQQIDVNYAGFPTMGAKFGTQDAIATPQPMAKALTDAPIVDAGLLTMYAPHAEATTRLSGHTREAVAIVSAQSLSILGGAMVLNDPKWIAIARSGDTLTADARFTYSSATILGIQRGPGTNADDLNAFKGCVEGFFGFLGLKLILPAATVTDGGDGGPPRVAISPMTVAIENMPLGLNLVGPLLRFLSPQLDAALADYLAQKCSNKSYELLADVFRGFLSGTGAVGLSVGGASAMTDDTYFPPVSFDLPVAAASLPPTPVTSLPSTPVTSSPPSTSGIQKISSSSSAPVTTSDAVVDVSAEEVVATPEPDVPAEVADAAPKFKPVKRAGLIAPAGKKGGSAGWMLAAALAGVLVLAGADQFVMRRSRRRFAG